MKSIKSDSDKQKRSSFFQEKDEHGDTAERRLTKKRSPGFSGKNKGETPSVAALGVTHPTDATE